MTAAELAAELEVSVPTARRDLEALAMSGVPIYPTRGRGGGWRLIGGARTDLTGLNEREATSLLAALSQSRSVAPEHVSAMRKLVRAMPEPFREGAERVAAGTMRDAPWGDADDAHERPRVSELQRAIAVGRQVRIDYEGERRGTLVDVVPLLVGSRGMRWYLLAAPACDGFAEIERIRTYRVDRIVHLELLEEKGRPPDDFDGAAAWDLMLMRVEGMRGTAHAVVRVRPWAVRAVCDAFGRQVRVIDEADGILEVRAHRTDALAEQLAGWVDVVDVVEPAEVREALRRLGERIVERYREP